MKHVCIYIHMYIYANSLCLGEMFFYFHEYFGLLPGLFSFHCILSVLRDKGIHFHSNHFKFQQFICSKCWHSGLIISCECGLFVSWKVEWIIQFLSKDELVLMTSSWYLEMHELQVLSSHPVAVISFTDIWLWNNYWELIPHYFPLSILNYTRTFLLPC